MLGKLIKYEMKSTWKVIGALLLFMLAMTVLASFSFYTPMWRNMATGTRKAGVLDIMGLLLLFTYFFTLFGVIWGALIYIAVHFYKSMYSDQGYLTHTLPVSAHQLMGSKILVNGIWLLLIMVVMLLSCIGLVATIVVSDPSGGENMWALIWEGGKGVSATMNEALRVAGLNTSQYLTAVVITILVGPFVSVASVFGALTIGQLFTKYKVIMGIAGYFAIGLIQNIIVVAIQVPIMIKSTVTFINQPGRMSLNMNFLPNIYISLGVSLITAIALYVASHIIITRKLNLD